jgi:uncharacterized membrane protein YfhO
MGKSKKEEKERVYTKAEIRRLEKFEKLTEDMKQQDYTRTDLTINLEMANILSIPMIVITLGLGIFLFFYINRNFDFKNYKIYNLFCMVVALFMLTIVHELIHAACWGIFAPNKFKDVEFGYVVKTMNPYATCQVPLKKWQYVFGAVMPLVTLGIIPMAVGIAIGSLNTMLIGAFMVVGAVGDMMIIRNILSYKSDAKDIVYIDHPTEGGGVIFER